MTDMAGGEGIAGDQRSQEPEIFLDPVKLAEFLTNNTRYSENGYSEADQCCLLHRTEWKLVVDALLFMGGAKMTQGA
jgi:hypothetical protein